MTQFIGKLRAPVLASAPASPASGQLYFDSSTSTLYIYNGIAWVDALTSTSASTGLATLEVAGHSLAAAGGSRVLPEYGYAFRVWDAFTMSRFRDYSIGGAVACWPNAVATGDGGYAQVLQSVYRNGQPGMPASGAAYSPGSQVAIIHYGLNDLATLGSTKPLPYQTALRTIMARFCASTVFENDNAAWSRVGTWTNTGSTSANSADTIAVTTTVNDNITLTLPADYLSGRIVGIGLFINSGWAAVTYGLTVDGVARTDITLTPANMTDQSAANKHVGHILRLGTGGSGDPVLADGTHTIKLTLKSGPSLAVDYGHIEADPADGPVLVMPLTNKPANYTLWNTWPHGPSAGTDPMNDAAVDTWKTAQRSVHNEFPGRVIEVDIDAIGLVKTTAGLGDFVSDGAHWNERGHAKVAEAVRGAIASSSLISALIRSRPSINPRPYWKQVGAINGAGAFSTGWANFNLVNSTLPTLRWGKGENGRIYVRGALKMNSGVTSTILAAGTLPKPQYHIDFACSYFNGSVWSAGIIRVQSDGALICILPTPAASATAAYTFDFSYDSELA